MAHLPRAEGRELRAEVIALILLSLSAFYLLGLQSEHAVQQGVRSENVCGWIGAELANLSFHFLGVVASYFLSALFVVWSLRAFFRQEVPARGWKLFGCGLLLLSVSTLEWHLTTEPLLPQEPLRGGVYGEFFGQSLYEWTGVFGTWVITLLLCGIGVVLATDLLISPLVLLFLRRGATAVVDGARQVPGAVAAARGAVGRLKESLPTPRASGPATAGASTSGVESKKSKRRAVPAEEDETEEELDPHAEDELEEDELEDDEEWEDEEEELEEDDEDEEEEDEEEEDEEEEDEEEEDEEDEDEEDEDEEEDLHGEDSESGEPRPERTIRLGGETSSDPPPFAIDEKQLTFSGVYNFPPIDFLEDPPRVDHAEGREELDRTAQKIEDTLASFRLEAKVHSVQRGPVITQYEVSLAPGIKVHKIVSLSDDLAMALEARSVRVVAPIPGKSTVGIEVPNQRREVVALKELLRQRALAEDAALPLFLGKDAAGDTIIEDLGRMPHLLVAGATGSGKSVCVNAIIASMLMTRSPEDLKMILIDPKMVELSVFEEIPHLLTPVITDMKKAPAALDWLVRKMDQRYEILSKAGVRHIKDYNALGKKELYERLTEKMSHEEADEAPEHLPYIVVIVDEFADLMMTAAKEVENHITRLAQKSRAVGIHVILATQRPSVNVITGLIKANLPTRISFMTASKIDSRTILDRNGAERLLGQGDMLYVGPATSELVRAQSTYISDKEIRKITKFLKKESQPEFSREIEGFLGGGAGDGGDGPGEIDDDLFPQAVQIVLESGRASTTLLQRRLAIGYTRASRLMDIMGDQGIVGPFRGSKPREILTSLEDWNQKQEA